MIKVFRGTDTNFNTNGEVILKPISADIVKNNEEEYIEVEAPLKYAEFLIQDNILIVDALTGKKGYVIHNPIVSDTIEVKAWLFYQEHLPAPADRGVVIAHKKNLENCKVTENWDDVVTSLTPVGYNDTRLPEGTIWVPSPYQKDYEKTIEFDLSDDLAEMVELMEENISFNKSLVDSLKNSVDVLTAKIPTYDTTTTNLLNEKQILQQRYNVLSVKPNPSEVEKKELAVITAQLPLIDQDLENIAIDKTTADNALIQTQADLQTAQAELERIEAEYNTTIQDDLRSQAEAYLEVNKYPQINYDLEAHLSGVVEVGDTVKVKHPDMRVDLLTTVTALKLDCLTMRFKQVEFGTLKPTLNGKLTEIEEKIVDAKETIKEVGRTVTKYRSEYKRDNEEMVSTFISELYGAQGGIYKMIEKNQSVLRQTAAEISGTVSRVNADLSSDIASLSIRADNINATVTANYNSLSSSISSVDIKANQIQSRVATVESGLTTAQSTITQHSTQISLRVEKSKVISEINQTAESIKISASKLDLTGLVTVTNLQTAGQTVINGGNITTGTLDCSKITVTNLSAGSITTGNLSATRISGGTLNFNNIAVSNLSATDIKTGTLNCSLITVSNLNASSITTGTLNCSNITVTNLSADSITSGKLDVDRVYAGTYRVMFQSGAELQLGATSTSYGVTSVNVLATQFKTSGSSALLYSDDAVLGKSGGRIGFFGGVGSTMQSMTKLLSSATNLDIINKVNQLLTQLDNYRLLNVS